MSERKEIDIETMRETILRAKEEYKELKDALDDALFRLECSLDELSTVLKDAEKTFKEVRRADYSFQFVERLLEEVTAE